MPKYYFNIGSISGLLRSLGQKENECVAILDDGGVSTEISANIALYDTLNGAVCENIITIEQEEKSLF